MLAAYRLAADLEAANRDRKKKIVQYRAALATVAKQEEKDTITGQMATLSRKLQGSIYGVYTIGQPRCGNRAFAEALEQRLPELVYRVINNRDIVPRLPPRAMNYRHAGTVRYFDEFGRLHVDPGLWYRLLDTVLIAPDEVKDKALEAIRDHNSAAYVDLLRRAWL